MSEIQTTKALTQAIALALAEPDRANLHQFLEEFEQALTTVPPPAQLQVAATMLYQLVDLYVARADRLLDDWEERHNPPTLEEPILTAEMLQEVLRHSMTLNLEEVLEVIAPQQRHTQSSDSLVEEVEKTNLLEFLEAIDEEQNKQQALQVAHNEDVSAWVTAIHEALSDFARRDIPKVSMLDVQRSLNLPLIEVWLGLLLGGFVLEQGEFYSNQVWIVQEL
jgi:hypothetical protein